LTTGTVYLVGAGPGDPGLLTARGGEVLARADVVVHDRLAGPGLLSLAPAGAERVDVGKQPDGKPNGQGAQEAINQLLITRARQGLRVVRLKGGDPFVFGRGGEEALALQAAGVPFEVVPGVTSAIAVPACAGVPVTHRGLAGAFTVVAGHSRAVASTEAGGTNWEALAAAGGTIVVLMGAARRARIAERLMAGGLGPGTPVLGVQWGTHPLQAAVRTTLGQLASTELAPPLTMVIGQVAALDLTWRRRPLSARTVVVTRSAHQAPDLSVRLRDEGAFVLELPVIAVVTPSDGGAGLAAAAEKLRSGAYSWVVFTSANGAHRFFEHVPDARAFAGARVAAVGPATADALRTYRVVADLMPRDCTAEGLLASLPAPPGNPAVLLPQAAGARSVLRRGLAELGWAVDTVEAYRTVPVDADPSLLAAARQADAICFASPSAVTSYLDQAGTDEAGSAPPVVACIGPTTAAAARARGLAVTVEASEHTVDGLVTALVAALAPHA
jgi:uroporphyrinogen III methyltransferase/synthase